jgi:hypothetical protein
VEEIATRLDLAGEAERKRLIAVCESALSRREHLRIERERVIFARLLVALFPDSLPLVSKALSTRESRLDFELHFSLFCSLDGVTRMALPLETKLAVEQMLEDYLLTVRKTTARAAWIAGDLLGDHREIASGRRILLRAVRTAGYGGQSFS